MLEFCKGRAWIELDREALRHNVSFLCSRLPKGCNLMPAVKANAYGHGAVLIAQECQKLGINAFCVATAQEGAELRHAGIGGELLVLGYTHPQDFPLLLRYGLTQTVLDSSYAETLNSWGRAVNVHVKIDTGMHRLGERCEHLKYLQKIFDCRNLHVTGTFTHLCTADGVSIENQEFLMVQYRSFYKTVNQLERLGYNCGKLHLMSSYALLSHPEIGGNYARVGIALYGVLSAKEDTDRFGADQLRPVLSLKARVALVRHLAQGEGAGYGLQFRADRNTKLATLSIGYADGLPRKLGGGIGTVLLHGRRAPIVGRICMDQTLVDVTDIPPVSPGDAAVLIGRSGKQELTACDLAEQTGTISNEILSRLGGRLNRMFQ